MELKLAPSILSADFSRLGEEIRAVENAGADWIHVDVMDGHFVPNLTIGPPVVQALRKVARKPLDVHLMIENPDQYLSDFVKAGSDSLTVHVEACRHLHRTLHTIRSLGKRCGVAVNPATPLEAIRPVLGDVDLVLLMTVNPGFGGQRFIDSVLSKIRDLRSQAPSLDIEVDGGIKIDNVATVAGAGANVIVSGSGVFGTANYGETLKAMRTAARTST